MKHHYHASRGLSIFEILIGVSVISVSFIAISSVFAQLERISGDSVRRMQAVYLLGEGLEVARLMRSDGWASFSSLSAGATYYLARVNGKWQATTTPQVSGDDMSRTVLFHEVFRDAGGAIVPQGGILDVDTRKATVRVSWNERGEARDMSVLSYLANLY